MVLEDAPPEVFGAVFQSLLQTVLERAKGAAGLGGMLGRRDGSSSAQALLGALGLRDVPRGPSLSTPLFLSIQRPALLRKTRSRTVNTDPKSNSQCHGPVLH